MELEQHHHPHGRYNFSGVRLHSRQRGALASGRAHRNLTQTVYSASSAPASRFTGSCRKLASMFSSKELAVVANVGSLVPAAADAQPVSKASATPVPLNLFSHSDQQLQWQTSIAQGNSPRGWAVAAWPIISSHARQRSTLRIFRRSFRLPAMRCWGTGATTATGCGAPGGSLALTGFTTSAASQARLSALNSLLKLDSGVALAQAANNTLSNSLSDAASLGAALAKGTPLKTTFPTSSSLGQQLQQVAQVIQVEAQQPGDEPADFLLLPGRFRHARVGELKAHNTLYPELSQAIAAFYSATQELGVANNVTTFTESDFSRTFQPTTSDGSDHAWGSHHMVVGGAVAGGQIYGSFPAFQLGGPNGYRSRAGAGFRRRRSISTARRWLRGSGFRLRLCRPCFRIWRISGDRQIGFFGPIAS